MIIGSSPLSTTAFLVAPVSSAQFNSSVKNQSEQIAARPVGGTTKPEQSNSGLSEADDKLSSAKQGSDSEAEQKQNIERKQLEIQEKQDAELIKELSARDREVRAHEQAHASVGGQYAGAPQYQFQRGPDGVSYAVGGEVSIDVSPAATPQETIRKMQVVRAAALAPAEPSAQDRRVAAQAAATQAQAQAELSVQESPEPETASGDELSTGDANNENAESNPQLFQKSPAFGVPADQVRNAYQLVQNSESTETVGRIFSRTA